MGENNDNKLPKFDSTGALIEFFETSDMGEYSDDLPEVHFDVELNRRSHYIEVDDDVAAQIAEISKRDHVPSGSIVNSWLREKLSNYSEKR